MTPCFHHYTRSTLEDPEDESNTTFPFTASTRFPYAIITLLKVIIIFMPCAIRLGAQCVHGRTQPHSTVFHKSNLPTPSFTLIQQFRL